MWSRLLEPVSRVTSKMALVIEITGGTAPTSQNDVFQGDTRSTGSFVACAFPTSETSTPSRTSQPSSMETSRISPRIVRPEAGEPDEGYDLAAQSFAGTLSESPCNTTLK